MSNVIQFEDRKRAKLEKIRRVHGANEARLCLLLAEGYPPEARPRMIELTLSVCREPHLARQALRAMGEEV